MKEVDAPKPKNKKGIFARVVDKIVQADKTKQDQTESQKHE